MSRLDSMIQRLKAQRDILNHLAEASLLPARGAILEVGLGNGRTFSHLREKFPNRRIIAFDRAVGAHASSIPAPADMVLGEIRESALPFAGQDAAFVHADIGTGYHDKDAITLTWLPGLVASMLAPGGIAASGLPLDHAGLLPLDLPEGLTRGRYHVYRKAN
ncbi:MAG: class I SAM-dependent methyltransferase [Pseudorhodobacter sp.]